MQVMIRIIKLERPIKIFPFKFDNLFECIYTATSARVPSVYSFEILFRMILTSKAVQGDRSQLSTNN